MAVFLIIVNARDSGVMHSVMTNVWGFADADTGLHSIMQIIDVGPVEDDADDRRMLVSDCMQQGCGGRTSRSWAGRCLRLMTCNATMFHFSSIRPSTIVVCRDIYPLRHPPPEKHICRRTDLALNHNPNFAD